MSTQLPNEKSCCIVQVKSTGKTTTLRKSLFIVVKLLAFCLLFLISAGYENVNPVIGKTKTEFYTAEFRELLQQEYKKSFLMVLSDSNDVDFTYQRLTLDFYRLRAFLPAWTINFNTTGSYSEMKSELIRARYKGLDSSYYNLMLINQLENSLLEEADNKQKLKNRIELETSLTKSAIKYMIHISSGINNTDSTRFYLNLVNSFPRLLNYAIDNGNLVSTIEQVQPTFYQYHNLCRALENYLEGVELDTLRLNSYSKTATKKQIADHLVKINLLESDLRYDSAAFVNAVMKFQRHHGLRPNGKIKKRTLKHLAKSTLYRYYQVALNLDRLRKKAIVDSNCIFVNIPEYKLRVIENGNVQHEHNVMVGKTYTQTPEFSSEITSIVANPYWTVPKSITFNEMLPKIKKDSMYLQRNGFMVIDNQENKVETNAINWNEANGDNFNYWIRQENGRGNALGNLKFNFPNKYRIYIHDTQSKRLFDREIRAFSHGCIRLQNPELLAGYLLNKYYNTSNDSLAIKALIQKKQHKNIGLRKSVPVHLKYLTCSADEKGNLFFFTDIYKKDEKAIKNLFTNAMPM